MSGDDNLLDLDQAEHMVRNMNDRRALGDFAEWARQSARLSVVSQSYLTVGGETPQHLIGVHQLHTITMVAESLAVVLAQTGQTLEDLIGHVRALAETVVTPATEPSTPDTGNEDQEQEPTAGESDR